MQQIFGVNTLGAMYGMKYAVPHMKPGSAIINTGSVAGLAGASGYSDYASANFALNGLPLVAAMEFGPLGICVTAICPATVNTPMLPEPTSATGEIALCKTQTIFEQIIEPQRLAEEVK